MNVRFTMTVAALAAFGGFAGPAAAQSGGAAFYDNGEQTAFEQAVGERELLVDAAEDFEDARPARGFLGLRTGPPTGPIDDPLDTNSSNEFFRPGQIPGALRFQSNRDNTGTTGPAPVGSRGLAISRPSSQGMHATPTTISSPFTQNGPVSTDVLTVDAAHEAYVLDVSLVRFSFVEPGQSPVGGPLTVRVFDEAGAALGTTVVEADQIGPFLGVIAPEGTEIGRINVSEPGGSELIHSVVAYDADGGEDTGNGPAAADPIGDLLESLGLG